MEKATLSGGQALAESLRREGIRVVFGIPGAGQYEATDAIYQEPSLRYIAVRHEQAASYMADGYARAGNEVAAVLVVPGPGLFNAASGMATAHAASSPMLVITSGGHHRSGDSNEMGWMRSLSKWVGRAASPAAIPEVVREAMHKLRTGRPQPVAIEIATGALAAVEEVEWGKVEDDLAGGGEPDLVRRAAQLLVEAERPVIWVGAGVQRADASAALQRLAEYLQAPVVSTRQGKGVLSDRHPLSLGLAELNYFPLKTWLDERDVVLAVGMSKAIPASERQVIRIDKDEEAMGPQEHFIVGDARLALEALYREAKVLGKAATDISAEVQALNRARFDPSRQLQPQWDLMGAVRAALPDDGILVMGMNQMGYYSRNYFPLYAARGYLTPSGHSTLGSAYPLALGAKLAAPERAVVALSGDGGFLYNAQELATAVKYGIHAVVVVFNDNAYGNVLRAQIEQFDGRVIGSRLHNPDFVVLAQAFGARGIRADGAAALESALRESLETPAPTVIEVPVGMMEREF